MFGCEYSFLANFIVWHFIDRICVITQGLIRVTFVSKPHQVSGKRVEGKRTEKRIHCLPTRFKQSNWLYHAPEMSAASLGFKWLYVCIGCVNSADVFASVASWNHWGVKYMTTAAKFIIHLNVDRKKKKLSWIIKCAKVLSSIILS